MSAVYSFNVDLISDSTPPEIKNVTASPDLQIAGGNVNISCDVSDDFGVDIVMLNISGPVGFEPVNVSMSGGNFYYNVSYSVVGNYSFFIWTNDSSGNEIMSTSYSFSVNPILDVKSPEISIFCVRSKSTGPSLFICSSSLSPSGILRCHTSGGE